jgi:ABC-type uncharacterized transport system substrate-binding protein
MRRREFLAAMGVAALSPVVSGQQERVRRVGVLIAIPNDDPQAAPRIAAIRDGLKERGWHEGSNIQFDFRFSAGNAAQVRAKASELVRARPDVIIAGNTSALAAIRAETRSIPVVFAQVSDPVRNGFVKSLAHPGGNITGFALFEDAAAVKWIELLKQLAPKVTRVAFVYDPANPSWTGFLQSIESAGKALGIEVTKVAVQNGPDIDSAIEPFSREPGSGLIVMTGPATAANRDRLIALASRNHLPAIYPYRYFVAAGGLASYGFDNIDLYRRATDYVDRILKGEKPANLPVQEANKFELVINLKTAKSLGLDVPITLLGRTDEVIE